MRLAGRSTVTRSPAFTVSLVCHSVSGSQKCDINVASFTPHLENANSHSSVVPWISDLSSDKDSL